MSISFNNVSGTNYTNEIDLNRNYNIPNKVDYDLKPDSIELSSNETKEKPINFKEGLGIYANGFKNKLKNMASSIIKHPIKTAALVLGTTAVLSALPLIGISTIAAGSALALLYAGLAIGKTTYHTVKFVKNNKNENYNEARKNLEQMGGDTVDLALTLPFVPKAVKNVKDFAKFGKIGVNQELINNIKESKGIKAKFNTLKAGNLKITEDVNFRKEISSIAKTEQDIAEYEAMRDLSNNEFFSKAYSKITKDMGISDIAPNPQLSDNMQSNMLGGFNNAECSIEFNAQAIEKMKQSEIINIMRHELEHYKQFSDIARYKGADYIYELNVRAYVERLKRGDTGLNPFAGLQRDYLKKIGEDAYIQEQIAIQKARNTMNIEAYQKAIDKLGVIKEGTPEALQAQKYIESQMKYPDLSFSFFGPGKEYTGNLLEVNARAAGENPGGTMGDYKKAIENVEKTKDTYNTDITRSILQGDSVIN